MKLKKSLLPFGEVSHVERFRDFYPHPFERWSMSNRRNDQPTGVFKANESPIKQVIDAGRQ